MSCLLLEGAHTLKSMEQQRETLLKLETAGSVGSQMIFQIRELPLEADVGPSLAKIAAMKEQLSKDEFNILASDTDIPGQESDARAKAQLLRQEILKLLDKTAIYLNKRETMHSKRITFLRKELFATGLAFQNLSEAIVKLERSANEEAPAKLARIRQNLFVSLVLVVFFDVAITIALAYLFSDNILKRLRSISHNLQMLATGGALLPRQSGEDEIAVLDAVLHDANRRVQDARRQQLVILENAAEIILSLDGRLKIMSISSAAVRYWHFQEEDLLGKSLVSLTVQAQRIRQDFEKLQQQQQSGELEFAVRCGDGVERIFSWSVSFLPDGGGEKFTCVARDITAQRQTENLKNNFIAMVSHDLRTPINSIGVSLAILQSGKSGPVPSQVVQELQLVENNIQKVTGLMNGLLELDKIESGRGVLQTESLHTFNIFSSAKKHVRHSADQREIKLDGPHGDGYIAADSLKLTEAVCSLLIYCIGRSASGGTIRMQTEIKHGEVEMRISDGGAQISLAEQQLLFEHFSSISLTVARAIVHAHGGRLAISSTKEQTCLSIFLPALPLPDDEEDL